MNKNLGWINFIIFLLWRIFYIILKVFLLEKEIKIIYQIMCTLNSFNSILNKKILMLLLMSDSFFEIENYWTIIFLIVLANYFLNLLNEI